MEIIRGTGRLGLAGLGTKENASLTDRQGAGQPRRRKHALGM